MTVVATFRATDAHALEQISAWTHDAHLMRDRLRFDEHARVAHLEFQQEPLDGNLPLPSRELVRESWWATEYRLPYVRCCLRVSQAAHVVVPDADLVGADSLTGVRWKPKASTVNLYTTWGPIEVTADRLDVALDVTDEITSVRKRRVGRLVRFDSTSGPLRAP